MLRRYIGSHHMATAIARPARTHLTVRPGLSTLRVMALLGERVADTCRRRGTATALLWETTAYDFHDLARRIAGTAAALRRRGVRPGDRVAVGLGNSPALVTTALGVIHGGAVLVPLNPAYTADELSYVVGDARARAAIVESAHADILAAATLPELSLIATDVAPQDPIPPATGDPETPALIIYTSGTTGRPKGAVLSHRALLSNLLTVAEVWRWSPADRLLLTLPCFHLHGLGLGIITSALVGSSVALRRRFVVDEVLEDLERVEATMFFGVPTMYNRLVALPETTVRSHRLKHMRLWVCGSAPLSAATFERFADRYGAQILDRYGMTECGFVLSGIYDAPRRAGVVGLPLPGIAVRLVDPEAADRGNLADVANGLTGEIVIRGPNLFSGYWGRPEDTARAFVEGHLRSGDLAVREADGMIRIVGRSSVDIIKTRGFKVGAVEIEDCLQRHPEVQEVAVVGVPDADQGERLVAVVTPLVGSTVTPEEIRSFARQHLAPHKTPSEVVLVADIPRTGPGKFKKKEIIRQLVSAAAAPRPA
jgi:acyl-CoA synthetase (AMP-forming)/AMP-acid ligase II